MTTPGSLPMADQLWLAAHDNVPRKSVLQPGTLGIGLAAGLIAELVQRNRITIDPQTADEGAQLRLRAPGDCGHVSEQPGCATCARIGWRLDAAQQTVLAGLWKRLDHLWQRDRTATQDLPTWLRYMQEPADQQYLSVLVTELVVRRLDAAGLVEQVERGLVRKKISWQPRDTARSGGAVKTISERYRSGASLTPDDFLLTGLVFAVGLDAHSFDLIKGADRDALRKRALLALPAPLQALLLTTQNLHHKAVLIR